MLSVYIYGLQVVAISVNSPARDNRSMVASSSCSSSSRMNLNRGVAAALLWLLMASSHGCCAKHKKPSSHKAHAAPVPYYSPAPPPVAGGNINPGYGGGGSNGTGGGGWLNARATWYGAPNGAGPDDNGGACGFKNVDMPPFSAMTSCGNEPIFKDGKGCGSCYQIRCVAHQACSGVPETVIITDMNYYPVAPYHFDLSGTAFGAMAKDDRNDELRHAGIIDIQFKRVPCLYPGLTVTFHVERGSNPYYLAVLVEYENGDGDVVQVDLMESRADDGEPTQVWEPMHESWGSIWRMDSRRPLQGPFSLRITNESGRTLVADQVIPADWQPDAAYSSIVQFD